MPPRKTQTNQTETKATETKVETKASETKASETKASETKQSIKSKKAESKSTNKDDVVVVKNKKKNDCSTVCALVESLVESIQAEITQMRTDKVKGGSVKFLQHHRKQLESVLKQFQCVMKLKGKRKVEPNSGFNRPVLVSDKMCEFLGKPHNSLVSRTEVTKTVSTYIKDHELFNKNDRKIHPDGKLLMIVGDKTPFAWIGELQQRLASHFIKVSKSTTSKSNKA
jgi:chromatin remodeling complex protein RSC6